MSFSIHSVYKQIRPLFRGRRMAQFIATFQPDHRHRILDVGGYADFWASSGVSSDITLLNIDPVPGDGLLSNMHTVLGNGTALTYEDKSFDIVFSNSVIEHLGSFENQKRFAKECMRVGRGLWIQTPSKSFPIEPHFLSPFIHFLPKGLQRRMLRNFTVWGWLTRPSDTQVEDVLAEIRLLTLAELEQLFPYCEIKKETFLGLTKSFIVVRKPPCPQESSALNQRSARGDRPD
jgi:Methyltransferase domain